ncbi:MAG: OmpA family protein [Myxococcota bacterium]|nr:OmpA family protein [Myxococcota bacterium]
MRRTLSAIMCCWVCVLSVFDSRVAQAQYDDDSASYYDEIAAGTTPAEKNEAAVDKAGSESGETDTSEVEPDPYGSVETTDTFTPMASADVPADPGQTRQQKPWDWRGSRHHLSLRGPTGLFHIIEAGSDKAGTFGLGVHGAFFRFSDYLYANDKNTQIWGGINLRLTPLEFLEIFIGLRSFVNYNNLSSPSLSQALGHPEIGVKGFFSPVDWITLGGLVGAAFRNPAGQFDVSFKGTNADLALFSTFDISKLNKMLPLRAHLNVGYLFDQSSKLVEDYERDQGGCDTDEDGDGTADYEGCLNPIARTALGINRNDQLRVGVGVDVLLPYVSPIVEYWLEIPVNRQDFTCPEKILGSPDSCLKQEGFTGMRQWVTLGARILPPISSLAVDVGLDLGLTGWAPSVHELAAQAPYRVIVGVSYGFGPAEKVAAPRTESVATGIAPPEEDQPKVVIAGYVHDATSTEKGIPGAVITYVDRDLTPQVTGHDGRFQSYDLPPGPLTLAVAADGYREGSFVVSIPSPEGYRADTPEVDGSDQALKPLEVQLNCPLVPLLSTGTMLIRVLDEKGEPMPNAVVTMKGPVEVRETSGQDGKVEQEVVSGQYSLTIEKEGYLSKSKAITLAEGAYADVEIPLAPKPKESNVVVEKKRIVIKKKIHFATGADKILPDAFPLLDEVAYVLQSHPDITRVEIQGHTDNRGRRKLNIRLSDKRARAVRDYLMGAGVAADRLEAKGYGPNKPIAPNITAGGRARNRRVEFRILSRTGDTGGED